MTLSLALCLRYREWHSAMLVSARFGEILERRTIDDRHFVNAALHDDALAPELAEGPAHSLHRQTQIVADIGARHRQVDARIIRAIGEIEEEGGNPFARRHMSQER